MNIGLCKDTYTKLQREYLFQYLRDELVASVTTCSSLLKLTSNRADDHMREMFPSQQKAYIHLMLHRHHAADHEHTKAYLRTVDTNVVIIAISYF